MLEKIISSQCGEEDGKIKVRLKNGHVSDRTFPFKASLISLQ